jgi:hypothetical protein
MLIAMSALLIFNSAVQAQNIYALIFDKTFPIDRSKTLADGHGKTFTTGAFTRKFYGYYWYQFDQAQNKLLVRVRTTNDRSRPPDVHYLACGIITFLSGGRTVEVAYHQHPARTPRRTYIDNSASADLAPAALASIDQVNLKAGWCRGTPERAVRFRRL